MHNTKHVPIIRFTRHLKKEFLFTNGNFFHFFHLIVRVWVCFDCFLQIKIYELMSHTQMNIEQVKINILRVRIIVIVSFTRFNTQSRSGVMMKKIIFFEDSKISLNFAHTNTRQTTIWFLVFHLKNWSCRVLAASFPARI